MAVWTLAKKEWQVLARDPRAFIILLGMPLIFILILGLALGEGFGQKPDDRLRVTLLDLDEGYTDPQSLWREAAAWRIGATPMVGAGLDPHMLSAMCMANANDMVRFPGEPWSRVVLRDLKETASIPVEILKNRQQAQALLHPPHPPPLLLF